MNDESVTEQKKQTFSKEEREFFQRLSEEKFELDLQSKLVDAIRSSEMTPVEAACIAVCKGMSVQWIHTITHVDTDTIWNLASAFETGLERGKLSVQLDALCFIRDGGTLEELNQRIAADVRQSTEQA
jgi:hypothetical protein